MKSMSWADAQSREPVLLIPDWEGGNRSYIRQPLPVYRGWRDRVERILVYTALFGLVVLVWSVVIFWAVMAVTA